jgi:OmpA-OmpF porin, OOP family
VADFLKEKKLITTLRVEGHMRGGGERKAAQTLSERRALAVARWLAAEGVDCKRLIAVGFGDTKPQGEAAATNERITFVNTALAGRLVGGMPADGVGKTAGDTCQK